MSGTNILYIIAAVLWTGHLGAWLFSFFYRYRKDKITAADMIENFYNDYIISVGAVILLCLIGIYKNL